MQVWNCRKLTSVISAPSSKDSVFARFSTTSTVFSKSFGFRLALAVRLTNSIVTFTAFEGVTTVWAVGRQERHATEVNSETAPQLQFCPSPTFFPVNKITLLLIKSTMIKEQLWPLDSSSFALKDCCGVQANVCYQITSLTQVAVILFIWAKACVRLSFNLFLFPCWCVRRCTTYTACTVHLCTCKLCIVL